MYMYMYKYMYMYIFMYITCMCIYYVSVYALIKTLVKCGLLIKIIYNVLLIRIIVNAARGTAKIK